VGGRSVEPTRLRGLLEAVQAGEVGVSEALDRLRDLPYVDLGFARVDRHRALRKGLGEVVFCQGKRPEQVVSIVRSLLETSPVVLATRAAPEVAAALKGAAVPCEYHEGARIIVAGEMPRPDEDAGRVLVLTAGTADIPVAEEAALTCQTAGLHVERMFDVGVAGLHRLGGALPLLRRCDACIVVAGMDGVLPSVVAGLTDCPVVAVPTSVGYGASFGGLAALLTMLNACASGVGVVNIDNGFGAGALAAAIARAADRRLADDSSGHKVGEGGDGP